MRIIIISILLCLGSGSLFGQLNFGAGGQVLFEGTAIGAQGKALYEWDDTWRGAGSFTLYFDNVFDWAIDLDAHYKLLKVSDNFDLAPLAGLNLTRASVSAFGVSVGDTDVNINLGAFVDFVPSDSYHIYVEPKIIIGGGSALVISGGILF